MFFIIFFEIDIGREHLREDLKENVCSFFSEKSWKRYWVLLRSRPRKNANRHRFNEKRVEATRATRVDSSECILSHLTLKCVLSRFVN